jgi:hypothetical protein
MKGGGRPGDLIGTAQFAVLRLEHLHALAHASGNATWERSVPAEKEVERRKVTGRSGTVGPMKQSPRAAHRTGISGRWTTA